MLPFNLPYSPYDVVLLRPDTFHNVTRLKHLGQPVLGEELTSFSLVADAAYKQKIGPGKDGTFNHLFENP